MSPATAEAIREPSLLGVPEEARERLTALFNEIPAGHLWERFSHLLSPQGIRRFLDDLLGALFAAQRENDLRPVRSVMLSYYWSSLFVMDPGFGDEITRAEKAVHEPPIDRAEWRQIFALQ